MVDAALQNNSSGIDRLKSKVQLRRTQIQTQSLDKFHICSCFVIVFPLMRSSCHNRGAEISVEPRNFRRTLDLLLFFSADHPNSE